MYIPLGVIIRELLSGGYYPVLW